MHFRTSETEKAKAMNDEKNQTNSPERSQICRIRGRSGLYRVLKRYARRARVALADQPDNTSFLIERTELRDLSAVDPEPHLFLDPTETDASLLQQSPSPNLTEVTQTTLPPLPFGLLDLDPVVVTDRGPPPRVKCYVAGCQEMLRPPTREFRGDICRHHGIRTHLSGSTPTFTYQRAERNLITAHRLFSTKLRGNKFKFETHRFGYERSEDALTWNVLRSFQEAGCLHDIARYVTGLELLSEPTLYLWGLRLSDDSLEPWDLLLEARKRFESRLPVKRPATEPDIALHLSKQYLVLIEAKLSSENPSYSNGPRKNGQSLTKDELLDIYHDQKLQILDVDKARSAERILYQLWRNLQFAEYMALLDSPQTKAFHANLVRAGCEHASTAEFRELIRPEFADRFMRLTWENIFTLAGLHSRKLSRLLEYMATKTLNLQPAFQLDLW